MAYEFREIREHTCRPVITRCLIDFRRAVLALIVFCQTISRELACEFRIPTVAMDNCATGGSGHVEDSEAKLYRQVQAGSGQAGCSVAQEAIYALDAMPVTRRRAHRPPPDDRRERPHHDAATHCDRVRCNRACRTHSRAGRAEGRERAGADRARVARRARSGCAGTGYGGAGGGEAAPVARAGLARRRTGARSGGGSALHREALMAEPRLFLHKKLKPLLLLGFGEGPVGDGALNRYNEFDEGALDSSVRTSQLRGDADWHWR